MSGPRNGAAMLFLLLSLAGCRDDHGGDTSAPPKLASAQGGSSGAAAGAAAVDPDPTAADYIEAPVVLVGGRTRDGLVTVGGKGPPDAIVRLGAPEGQSWGMTAGVDGQWSFAVPLSGAPRMLSLTSDKAGRAVHADGAVVLLPEPGAPVIVARSGYGARPIGLQSLRPVIVALDYDGGGGGIISGVARSGSVVRLSIDGRDAGGVRTDAQGRFVASAVKQPLKPGRRLIRVENADGAAQLDTDVQPTGRLDGVYAARRQSDGWRLDWRSSAQAIQTTVVFDSSRQALARTLPSGDAR
jgi:hypothetical protein